MSKFQTAYIKNRFIGYNTRLIEDIFEYSKIENKQALIAALDFQKAFHSLEWPFMMQVMEKMNFGPNLLNIIKTIYKEPTMCVKNNRWMTRPINMTCGVKQGLLLIRTAV